MEVEDHLSASGRNCTDLFAQTVCEGFVQILEVLQFLGNETVLLAVVSDLPYTPGHLNVVD